MGRRIVAGAALAALMVVLSACAMHGGASSPPPASHTVTYSNPQPAATQSRAQTAAHAAPAKHCKPAHDCTACYRSEADRDMGRLNDDLSDGGCCIPCGDGPCPHSGH